MKIYKNEKDAQKAQDKIYKKLGDKLSKEDMEDVQEILSIEYHLALVEEGHLWEEIK